MKVKNEVMVGLLGGALIIGVWAVIGVITFKIAVWLQ